MPVVGVADSALAHVERQTPPMVENAFIRNLAILVAFLGGSTALIAYVRWMIRASVARRGLWFAYFSVLFVVEALFAIVYLDGWSRYPEPSVLPITVLEFFALFAIPLSVGWSAAGWLAMLKSEHTHID